MRGKRFVLGSALGALVLALVADPVAAQSTTAELIHGLNFKLLAVAVPITLLTEAVLFYTVWKYRKSDEPQPTRENRRLEITWTVATAVILLFVGAASYGVLANEHVSYTDETPIEQNGGDGDEVVVHADAFQWGWDMTYPNHGNITAEDGETGPKVYVPADTRVYFHITSQDVIHGFAVPELGLKQDAVPGREHTVMTVPEQEGTYQGYCTEYCGVGHSGMYFEVEVVSQEEFDQWVEERQQAKEEEGGDGGDDGGDGNESDGGDESNGDETEEALVAVAAY